jgi:hypothetical protein
MPFRRLKISFNQGGEWKALIREYITTIASKAPPSWVAAQSKSGWPALKATVSSAMIAKVGEAARASKWTAAALMLSGMINVVFVMLSSSRSRARILEPTHCNVLSTRDRGQGWLTTATGSCLRARPT